MSNSHKVMTALIVPLWSNCLCGKFLTNFIDSWILVIGMAWFLYCFCNMTCLSSNLQKTREKLCVTFAPKMPMFEGPVFRGRWFKWWRKCYWEKNGLMRDWMQQTMKAKGDIYAKKLKSRSCPGRRMRVCCGSRYSYKRHDHHLWVHRLSGFYALSYTWCRWEHNGAALYRGPFWRTCYMSRQVQQHCLLCLWH
jgi:hypothetical protein